MFIPKPKEYKVCAREDIDDGSPVHLCNKYISFQCPEWGGAGWDKRVSIKLQQLLQALSGLERCFKEFPTPYVMVSQTLIRIRRLCIVYIHIAAIPELWIHSWYCCHSTYRYIYIHYNLHVSCQVALLTVMIFFNCTYMRPLLATPRIVPTNEGRGV